MSSHLILIEVIIKQTQFYNPIKSKEIKELFNLSVVLCNEIDLIIFVNFYSQLCQS